MDLEAFYSADERRRHSAELEFGRDWHEEGHPLRGVVGRGHRRALPDARADAAVVGDAFGDMRVLHVAEEISASR